MESISSMTREDLQTLIQSALKTQMDVITPTYVHGMEGLAKLLGVSKRHAQRIKSTGCLDKAIIQRGRTIIVNSRMALQLFDSTTKPRATFSK